MAVAFNTIKAGDRLYDVHSERAGNTTARRMGVWDIYIKEIDHAAGTALVSWNGNPPTKKTSGYFLASNIRRTPPEWLSEPFEGPKCSMCYRKKSAGHSEYCEHPKAVAARKKAAGAQK